MDAFLTITPLRCCAPRLARPELSQEENEAIYGKCARPMAMAQLSVDVTVRVEIDPRTGMVCDLSALQRLVDDLVLEPLTTPSSTRTYPSSKCAHDKNVALHIADRLSSPIKAIGASLQGARKSPNNAAEVYAEAPQLEMSPAALDAVAVSNRRQDPRHDLLLRPVARLVLAISLDGQLQGRCGPAGGGVTVVLWSRHWHGLMPADGAGNRPISAPV